MESRLVYRLIAIAIFVVFAPIIGGFLDGVDRKLSARMQGRKGPSVLQPFYDVKKLFQKQFVSVNRFQLLMVLSYLVFVMLSGAIFFGGFDILLCIFSASTAAMFLILAATYTHSPFSGIGADREMIQMMSYEPMELLVAIGFYLANGTFNGADIVMTAKYPTILIAPGFFIGFVYILTIKFRKSPFDISTSHHAHQEVVKGVTTEMAGAEYGIMTIAEWYENVIMYGMIALFIITTNPISYPIAIAVVLLVFFLEILIDNTTARVKWQLMLKSAWIVALVCGGLNLLILEIIR